MPDEIPAGYTLPQVDLDLICAALEPCSDRLRAARFFITGGTGFFGAWIVGPLLYFSRTRGLGVQMTLVSRSPERFAAKMPHVASAENVRLVAGDVRTLVAPDGPFDYVIHAATDADAAGNKAEPLRLVDSVVAGTRNVLDAAVRSGAKGVLLTSSGAVYGPQPPDLTRVPEEYLGGPDPASARSAYGEAKRYAELLGALYAEQHGLEVKIARCFAFVGPYLPLDRHFAIGNFMRDALAGRRIDILGDGTPYRSYQYAADLAVWLWRILFDAPPARPYNVGSENAVSIAETARAVASAVQPAAEVHVARAPVPGKPPERYVPDVQRATRELGLQQTLDLNEAVRRTLAWHRRQSS